MHGHTPTVGSGDFDSVTGGKSTTLSYLSENPNRQNSRGRANKIRVYNIDEGMSPPYYSGDDSIYSITRMPTGLRIETDEFSSLEANSSTDKLVKINPDHSIDIDSRTSGNGQRMNGELALNQIGELVMTNSCIKLWSMVHGRVTSLPRNPMNRPEHSGIEMPAQPKFQN